MSAEKRIARAGARTLEPPARGTAPADAVAPWHALTPAATLTTLVTGPAGLTSDDAAARLERSGPNAVATTRETAAWRLLVAQYRGTVTVLLAAAAAAALWMREYTDATAIVIVLLLNGFFGFITEYRAQSALAALRRLTAPRAVVVRDGVAREVDARTIVPGDVIAIESGDAVPADARLLEAYELSCGEASLTGESAPAPKDASATLEASTPLPDRRTMVFMGTTVASGSARAVVVATGSDTELGEVGRLVAEVRPRATPLERRLDDLGRTVAVAAMGAGAVIAIRELLRGGSLALVVETGLAVAVAAVPEGLPAVVTITAALATRRMARRNAIVRRLAAVEALGSTTVVCTDKTGTLTAGEQTVTTAWLYDDDGGAVHDGPQVDDRGRALLAAALLTTPAAADGGGAGISADPTDVAFSAAAERARIDRHSAAGGPRVAMIPFASERMLAAAIHGTPGALDAKVKGAVSALLPRCASIADGSAVVPLNRARVEAVLDGERRMAERGLRVIAVAGGPVDTPALDSLRELTLLGLVGLEDPPATDVPGTLARLRDAGIRTVMLTGDQAVTAQTVARRIGLADEGAITLDAQALDSLDDRELDDAAAELAVVARISPAAKLRVIEALQRRGEIVAMLGDGVNDAPALRRADIGVALGRRGTAVAREAADLVLADDRLATVAAAVEEGRVVYDNVQRFVFYLFSCNLAEVTVLLGASAFGLPLPLTPLQILWLNLLTDTLPALALAVEPAEADVMQRPPRAPASPILTRTLVLHTLTFAALIAGASLAALAWVPRAETAFTGATMAFTTLALAQLFHVGNARRRTSVLAPRVMLANRSALVAVAICLALQVVAVVAPPLARVLGTHPLSATEWLVSAGLAVVPAVLGQAWRVLKPATN